MNPLPGLSSGSDSRLESAQTEEFKETSQKSASSSWSRLALGRRVVFSPNTFDSFETETHAHAGQMAF